MIINVFVNVNQRAKKIISNSTRVFIFICAVLSFSPAYAESINSAYYETYKVDYTDYVSGYPVSATALYIVPKRSILLLHGDIITPINFMPDLPSYVLSTVSSGQPDLFYRLLTYNYPIPIEGLNAENINDFLGGAVSSITLASAVGLFDGDFTGDGQSDLLVSDGFKIQIISQQGSVPSLHTQFTPPSGYQISSVRDIDGDGRADIQLSVGSNQYAFVNDSNGGFVAENIASGLNTSLVGTMGGQFRVNEQGAATYNIPIMTFAGTAGVVPQVNLAYSSQGGSGIAGVGWSVGGLSAISRCRQTLGQDGEAQPLNFDASDRFCLDGQRLMLTSGTYGSDGSKYRTEIDTGTEVTANGSTGNPESFTVTRKDGSTSTYGGTTNANYQAGSSTLTWGISEFADSAGNPIKFHYDNDADGFRVKRIEYAFGSATTTSTYIDFTYEPRPDVRSNYINGVKLPQNKRLSKIDTVNNGNILRRYQLQYMGLVPTDSVPVEYVNADQSYLQQVYECVGNQCFQPTTFDWHVMYGSSIDSTPDFSYTFTTQNDRVASWKPIDINGDAIGDLVWVVGDYDNDGAVHDNYVYSMLGKQDGTGYENPRLVYKREATFSDNSEPMLINVIDYNADGRQDIALWDYSSWKIILSKVQTGGGWQMGAGNNSVDADTNWALRDTTFADVNSDGLVDLVSGQSIRYLEINPSQAVPEQGYVFGSVHSVTYGDIPEYDIYGMLQGVSHKVIDGATGDINGDGRNDIFVHSAATYVDWGSYDPVNGPTSFTLNIRSFYTINDDNTATKIDVGSNGRSVQAPDINNDGFSDWTYATSTQNTYNDLFYVINNGLASAGKSDFIANIHNDVNPQFVDYNRDGFADVAWHDIANSKLKIRYWNPATELFGAEEIIQYTSGNTKNAHILMDMNGDGTLDYVRAENNKVTVYNASAPLSSEGAIVQIDNGMGNETVIEYERLTNAGVNYVALDNRVQHEETTTTSQQCGGAIFAPGYYCYDSTITEANADNYYNALNGDWNVDLAEIYNDYGLTPQFKPKTSPVLELAAPINIVTRVESTAPTAASSAATSAISYSYSEAKIQAGGRGLLGFRTIKTKDEQSKVIITTRYRQDFPFIGSPLYTEVRSPIEVDSSDYTLVKKSFNDYRYAEFNDVNPATKRYQMWASNIVETTYDLNGVETSHNVTQTDQPDTWGNVTGTTVSTYSANDHNNFLTQVETSNVYNGGTDGQRYGRLSLSDVVHRRAGTTAISKQSSFTYYTSGLAKNLLKTETVSADTTVAANGQATASITTTYEYGAAAFGNKTKATVSTGIAGEDDRFTEWYYSSDGRYLEYAKNSLGHITDEVLARDDYGNPTEISGLNGYQASITTDELGRETYRSDNTGAWQQTTYTTSGLISGATYSVITEVAGGGSSTEYFDSLGRSIAKSSVGFDGLMVWNEIKYDSSGRVTHQSIPYRIGETIEWAINEYDVLGRPKVQTSPDGSTTQFNYNGLKTTVTNALNQTHTERRNAAGELIEVQDVKGGLIKYTYTATGQLATSSVTADGNTITTILTYNNRGQKVKMFDPDKGTWFYRYNGFGELDEQFKVTSTVNHTGSLSTLNNSQYQRTVMVYDTLGRMTQRTDYKENNVLEGNSTWKYDTAANGEGKLHTESGGGLTKTYSYGSYADSASATRTDIVTYTGGIVALMSTTYDAIGRPLEQIDGMDLGSGTVSGYNAYGYLDTVADLETGNVVYDVVDTDARGNVTKVILQGGEIVTRTYDQNTGRLITLTGSTALGSADIQNLVYDWDLIGNMKFRDDQKNKQAQSFCYDALNRLTKTHNTLGGACDQTPAQQDQEYNGFGNIIRKVGVGTYTYSPNMALRPHAVSSAGGISYIYDNNGNVVTDGNVDGNGNIIANSNRRDFIYSSFDKITRITKDMNQIEFEYGADRSRWKREDTDTNTNAVTTTYYLGSVEKVVSSSGTRFKRTIGGFAIWIHDNNGTLLKRETLFKDALGSVVSLRDYSTGTLTPTAFNPWGERAMAANWNDVVDGSQLTSFLDLFNATTTRGFTGHEMLDAVGVVHMNGRVYDARLGRFLQADPNVDGATNTQGYNRYSYVGNNPLSYTDPTGYFKFKDVLKIAVVVVLSVVTYGAASAWAVGAYGAGCAVSCSLATASLIGGTVGGAAAGFVAGVAGAAFSGASGSEALKAGLWGAVSGAAFGAIGGSALELGGRTLAHGLTGGVLNVLQGGKFGHGFISAGLTKFASAKWIGGIGGKNWGSILGRTAIASVVGGTTSRISGGKFANGARTAAFAHLFNQESGNIKKQLNETSDIETTVKFKFNIGKFWVAVDDGWNISGGWGNDNAGFDTNGNVTIRRRLKVNEDKSSVENCTGGNVVFCAGQENGSGTMSLELKDKRGPSIKIKGADPLDANKGMLGPILNGDLRRRQLECAETGNC